MKNKNLVEEDPKVMELKRGIEKRVAFLHREFIALGFVMKNFKRFLQLYGRFYQLFCEGNNPRSYSHQHFLKDFLENGDLKRAGSGKSQEWLEWHLKEVENTLDRMEPYATLKKQNSQMWLENHRLKHEHWKMSQELQAIKPHYLYLESLHYRGTGEPSEPTGTKTYRLLAMYLPITELEVSTRTYNVLRAFDIETLGELIMLTENELLKFRNFGKKSLDELKEALAGHGLYLGMDPYEEPSSVDRD